MSTIAAAALFACALWWSLTGAILYLDALPRSRLPWAMILASLVLAAALPVVAASATHRDPWAAYVAFGAALLVWAWVEFAFLSGYVTGPRKHPCPVDCTGLRHFAHAAETVLYHEMALAAAGTIVFTITQDAPNRVAAWTFAALWCMRLSAKLNLFLGVRNRSEQLLPAHLAYLGAFFGRRTINPLFPFSILAAAAAFALLAARCIADTGTPRAAGSALIAALVALGLLEHCFLVLPFPSERLWSWYRRETVRGPRI